MFPFHGNVDFSGCSEWARVLYICGAVVEAEGIYEAIVESLFEDGMLVGAWY